MKENILEQIVLRKKDEVSYKKRHIDANSMKESDMYRRPCLSLKKTIRPDRSFLIAEFKRKSPSKGIINATASPIYVARAYQNAGASAVSILTDEFYFMGKDSDIVEARGELRIPILRKDFIIDPFQIHETKNIGADIMLLIAAILSKEQIEEYASIAREIGLETIVEIHDEKEIDKIPARADFVGINNRNLSSFKIDTEHAKRTIKGLSEENICIAESGIHSVAEAEAFIKEGFMGLLVGEYLMRSEHIEDAVKALIFKR